MFVDAFKFQEGVKKYEAKKIDLKKDRIWLWAKKNKNKFKKF
jgi:hypothetical protein